ncbi:MAG: S8 family serine peptidase, partial [Chitinophagaceae bacterium]
MKRIAAFCLVLFFFTATQIANAQVTRYLVKFRNKNFTPFTLTNPSAYLSQRSIDRRSGYGIGYDSTDLPITPRYIDSITKFTSVTVLNISKWLNQVSVQTSDAGAISAINNYSFVESVSPIAARRSPDFNDFERSEKMDDDPIRSSVFNTTNTTADFFNYGQSFGQVHIHNGEFLHNIGLRGQNMIIGMLDAGYTNYLTVRAFDSARANGQILGTWDFVQKHENVNEDHSHGMQCFSTIAANIPGQFVGTAPKAGFYLFRSEDAATEYPIEEHNWVCAAERVDSVGGDLISSSLGYTSFEAPIQSHTYAEMNGNTTIAAMGADLAAKKGILVLNAAGNDGANGWKFIGTPADGDSVLAVGAVDVNGAVAAFSSFGPSSDGQVKPDVAAVGINAVVQFPNNTIARNNGTSFATPIMAGLATCLWQGFRELNNMKIINALRQAGNTANAPNDRIGYGIPDVKKAVMSLLKEFSTASVTTGNCQATINWTSKDVAAMKYEIERKTAGDTAFTKIAERFGTGNVFTNHSYRYDDPLSSLSSGTVQYRIRQVIDTAATSFMADYIDTMSLNIPTCNSKNRLLVVPNPVRNNSFSLQINTEEAQPLDIKIINALGQTLIKISRTKPSGAIIVPVTIQHFTKGNYFIQVT